MESFGGVEVATPQVSPQSAPDGTPGQDGKGGAQVATQQDNPPLFSGAKLSRIQPGQRVTISDLEGLAQQRAQEFRNAAIIKVWPEPHWLHVVSDSSQDHPSEHIRTLGLWECPLTMLMLWAFNQGCLSPSSSVVDIGMNVGWFSALAAASGRSVIAFEPNPTPRSFMEKTVALNGWDGRVRLINGGASSDGASLYVNAAPSAQWGSLAAPKSSRSGLQEVKSYRLDDVVGQDLQVCVMKVDCQGCEKEAFSSGVGLLARGSIDFIMLEYDFSEKARDSLQTLSQLSSSRWSCVALPMGLDCPGRDLSSTVHQRRLWDFVAAGVIEDCQVEAVQARSPRQPPQGLYLDLWLMREGSLARLKAHPGFAEAASRLRAAANLTCTYKHQSSGLGVCDMACVSFASLAEAKRACDARPSCTKIVAWQTKFELRGDRDGDRPSHPNAHVKQSCVPV